MSPFLDSFQEAWLGSSGVKVGRCGVATVCLPHGVSSVLVLVVTLWDLQQMSWLHWLEWRPTQHT